MSNSGYNKNLKFKSKTVHLNQNEIGRLKSIQSGSGGFQGLIRRLQGNVSASGSIPLSSDDREKIYRYAFKYTTGGWQSQLQYVFSRSLGNNLDQ